MTPPEPATFLTVRIPKALRRRLRVFCVTEERTLRDVVAEAIQQRLRRNGRRG